jgi:hypothetical protein
MSNPEQTINGALGSLYSSKAANMRRNRVTLIGEGLTMDEYASRIELYGSEGPRLWAEFATAVDNKMDTYNQAGWMGWTK